MKKIFFTTLIISTRVFAQTPGPAATTNELRGMVDHRCSGVIVDFKRKLKDKAVFLTAGHCTPDGEGTISPGTYLINQQYRRAIVNVGIKEGFMRVTPGNTLYASVDERDVAFIELEETYQQLKDKGAKIYKISNKLTTPGTPIQIISGYWKERQSCTVDHHIPLLGSTYYSWANSTFYVKCPIRPGYSGSPVLNSLTKEVVGVLSLGTRPECSSFSIGKCVPERDINGKISYAASGGYVMMTNDILNCVNDKGSIDLSPSNCKLKKTYESLYRRTHPKP
jgi:V8-like Glu-specific endopeptidase